MWPWRDNYHIVNHTNFILSKVNVVKMSKTSYNQIAGQALFLRSLTYYNLATYYQNVPLITDYTSYSNINTIYASNNTQDKIFDQIEADLTKAIQLLPSRNKDDEWAKERVTYGAATGYLTRTLMFHHKYTKAYIILKNIITNKYGHYKLTANYNDNFKKNTKNNIKSLFKIQFLDFNTKNTDKKWTPININSQATQDHTVKNNYTSQTLGS